MSAEGLGDRLFIGIGGFVVCLDPVTGEEVWRRRIQASDDTATVAIVGEGLYGAAFGELCRLDPATGEILWRSKLPKLGTGVITFPASGDPAVYAAIAQARRRRQV